MIDTAISYRWQRAERSVGTALAHLLTAGTVTRDEVLLCSKAGYIPDHDPVAWFARFCEEHGEAGLTISDLSCGDHCLHPEFLRHQLRLSLANLGVDTLDVYYLHNPERQLSAISRELFENRLQAAFAALEREAVEGRIAAYGLAVWDALWAPIESGQHLELERIQELAQQAAGGGANHFRFVQMPLNLATPQALLASTQTVDRCRVPALEAAHKLGLVAIASSSLARARLVGNLSPLLKTGLGSSLKTDAQRALQLPRSCPGVACALVGMKSPSHVEENLALARMSPLPPAVLENLIRQLTSSG